MEKWQSGDADAFEALFRQHEKLVFRNACLMTGTKEEAEDVLQEVFISVWRCRRTFDPAKGKLTTWLHRITINECLRRQRKKRPNLVPFESIDLPDTQKGQEEVLVSKQEYERLIEAMNSLNSKHRSVLVLRYFNDLSYGEIAEVVGIPLGTVKSRIYEALRILRGQLGGRQREASA